MFLRSITIVLLAACINAPLLADEEYTQAQIKEEIAKYSRKEKNGTVVRNVGFGFMGAGALSAGVGGVLAANGSTEGNMFIGLGMALFGAMGFGAGGITAITGGVIRHVSQKKRIYLESRLSIKSTGNGMAVVFAF